MGLAGCLRGVCRRRVMFCTLAMTSSSMKSWRVSPISLKACSREYEKYMERGYSGSKRNPYRSASRRWKRSLMPRGSTFTASRSAQRTRWRTASPVNRRQDSRS